MPRSQDISALKSVRDLVRWGASEFGRAGLHFGHGTDNALDEAFHLVLHALHLSSDVPVLYLEAAVTASERTAALKLLRTRVKSRKPAAYLLGRIEFCGLEFEVDERVLVPRSPIAEMIENRFSPWLNREPMHVLDLCAGSGCIGIAIAHAFHEAVVDLGELSAGALEICRRNIARHHLDSHVKAIKSDLFQGLQGPYDLIVSNPPYVPVAEWKQLAAEYHHEPRMALAAGVDGMDIVARILSDAPKYLAPGGLLVCEVGGSVEEFEARWPKLPVTWVEFERGGDGVFVITREDLQKSP
ncbi:MAG: 50S ribosomal protein L3 N(5)-glutamine methyltransferase [Stenotrophobium sp.]